MYTVDVIVFIDRGFPKCNMNEKSDLSESHKLDSSRWNEALQVIGAFGNGTGPIRICRSWLIIKEKKKISLKSRPKH